MKRPRDAPIESSLVGATQIAALAEVGPSAVSNWRNRFDDFPRPVESVPGGRDLFELKEVESWLRTHGKLRQEGRTKQILFQAADLLRRELSTASMTETLGAALSLAAIATKQDRALGRARDLTATIAAVEAADPHLTDVLRPLLTIRRDSADQVLDLIFEIPSEERPTCFDWLLDRYDEQRGGLGHSSGEAQTALLSALLDGAEGVVYDPAAGSGGFLVAAADSMAGNSRLFGQEANSATSRIARQRFLVHDLAVSMATGDTLSDDKWPDLRADVVVCDPPYQVKRSWPGAAADDPRWVFGPPPRFGDFAWLQHALYHLAEGGRAYVFLPPGSLFRSGQERGLRTRLLAHGMVEAVVSLPAGSSPRTGIPLVLWILRRAQSASEESPPVLLVDPLAATAVSRTEFVDDSIPKLASLLREWRETGELSERGETIAAPVPVEDLQDEDANMVPARWLYQDLTVERREEQEKAAEQSLAAIRKSRRAIRTELDIAIPSEPPAAKWTTVGHLVRDGVVEIVTGSPVKAEDFLSHGVRVFRPRDASAAGSGDSAAVYVSPEDASQMAMTEAGDIVVSPVGGPARAFVDHEGGHVLARPVQALRLSKGFMDPEVVAAFLESERNRRFITGSVMPRVSVRDLEVPLLTANEAAELHRALEALREQEWAARELAASARDLRQALIGLASPDEAGRKGGWRQERDR